jgi:hypothetical protein
MINISRTSIVLERHGRGIHAVWPGRNHASVTEPALMSPLPALLWSESAPPRPGPPVRPPAFSLGPVSRPETFPWPHRDSG